MCVFMIVSMMVLCVFLNNANPAWVKPLPSVCSYSFLPGSPFVLLVFLLFPAFLFGCGSVRWISLAAAAAAQ